MKLIIRSLLSLLFVSVLAAGSLGVGGCGGSTAANGNNNNNNNNNSTSCASGDNDFWVVENAECADGEGKLSRINPDEGCKEEFVTSLSCPVDFVLGSDGKGYLSTRSSGIYQINLNAEDEEDRALRFSEAVDEGITSAAGLALIEDLNAAEREEFCGGNTLATEALFIADEGNDTGANDADGGTLWKWCLVDDGTNLSNSPGKEAFINAGEGIENFRGVAVLSRDENDPNETEFVVTGEATDDTTGAVVRKKWGSNSQAEMISTVFSTDVKDITIDSEGRPILADNGGDGMVALLRLDDNELDSLSDIGSPRDILPKNDGSFLVTDFDAGTVSLFSSITDENPTVVTDGIELSNPNGIAQ